MSRSYLVITRNLRVFPSNNPDHKIILPSDSGTIGIQQTQDLIRWASLKPYQSPQKTSVISSAENMTLEAQNNLLKLLEEPPENTTIILITKSKASLLNTVISRCQIILWDNLTPRQQEMILPQDLPKSEAIDQSLNETVTSLEQKLFSNDLVTAFFWIEKLCGKTTRYELVKLLNSLALKLHGHYQSRKDLKFLKYIDRIEATKEQIQKNANLRLSLENLYLNLNGSQS